MLSRPLAALLLLAGLIAGGSSATQAGAELTGQIRARGMLRCGVSDGVPGFAQRDAAGRWQGFETDICRAVAAAVTGDPARVEYVPLAASARFPTLALGRIDLLLANTSWTLSREALLGVRFAAAVFHDGQSFLVPAASAAQEPRDLRDAEVCVEKDTTHAVRLRDFAAREGVSLRAREAPGAAAAMADLVAGRCAALTAESAQLAALRQTAGVDAEGYRLLPRMISREVLSALVRAGDPAWETTVRWVVYALLIAEENGIDAQAAAKFQTDGALPDYAKAWGVPQASEFALVARTLGVEAGWLLRAVAAVGNYREVFDRNLGAASPLALERGPNRLWNEGGLLFAPPLR